MENMMAEETREKAGSLWGSHSYRVLLRAKHLLEPQITGKTPSFEKDLGLVHHEKLILFKI